MEFYRKKGVKDLEDSEATEHFVHKFNALCDSMNSHGPKDAVRANNDKLQVRFLTSTEGSALFSDKA